MTSQSSLMTSQWRVVWRRNNGRTQLVMTSPFVIFRTEWTISLHDTKYNAIMRTWFYDVTACVRRFDVIWLWRQRPNFMSPRWRHDDVSKYFTATLHSRRYDVTIASLLGQNDVTITLQCLNDDVVVTSLWRYSDVTMTLQWRGNHVTVGVASRGEGCGWVCKPWRAELAAHHHASFFSDISMIVPAMVDFSTTHCSSWPASSNHTC